MTTDPMANAELRILMLEDSATDADLIQRELRRNGLIFRALRVDTKLALRTALRDFAPDVVLSDLTMPAFDGFEGLEITREILPTVPFIYVSGTIGEERAIELLKRGATDYALKQNLGRLASVVERALRDVEAERKRRSVEEQIRKLSRAVEQSPTVIMITDAAGEIEYVNPRFVEVTGYSAAEVMGQNPRLLKSAETPAATYRDLWESVSAGRDWRGEFRNQRKNGELYWVFATISPVRNEAGEITHLVAVQEDITERKAFEQKLQEKNAELERANRTKDRFLATMSHELRTPLNAVLGFTGTLLMGLAGPLNEKQKKQLGTIKRSAMHLLSLINDLLDIAKIDSGGVELALEAVECRDLIAEVTQSLRLMAEEKGLQLEVLAPRHDVMLTTDRRALQQILINLTNNAIKFTATGCVRIVLRAKAGTTEIAVHDTGIGIAPGEQMQLFGAFARLANGSAMAPEGAGLGLHLSQRLAGLLGGHITCDSVQGHGSTFAFVHETKR